MSSSSPPIPVFTPSASIGGVEMVARQVYTALSDGDGCSRLHVGLHGIAGSARPRGRWMALTWKTEAAAMLRHPGVLDRGLLWLHGAELTRDSGRVHTYLRSRVLNGTDQLLAVSPLALQLLPPHLRERVQLVGPPVPAADHAAAHAYGRDPRAPGSGGLRLLSVGRAVARKGHDRAIEVARLLADSAAVRLDVVGPGPDISRLEELAAAASCTGLTIHVHGTVTDLVKDQLYADADALLFLPRAEAGEYEGLGLVVLEAAARGCPAVVVDCGGSRYGVADGRSGIVLPPEASTQDIAEAVAALTSTDHARQAAARFAAGFALSAWQRRVRALAAGDRPDWRWPDLA
ncbi:MAG: hypothetical protein JWM02_1843 [Frankiales bacterium]|nr:hypothetical protein [Frankiales bacterium]